MPMHDWSRVEPTIYHHFHQQWTAEICKALNGLLPPGFSALIEQWAAGLTPDVLTVERRRPDRPRSEGVATLPRTRLTIESREDFFVKRANRVAIRHRLGDLVCVIEVVSPGNKSGRHAIRSFVEKTHEFLRSGVNVLLIDPFPPGPRDPHSLHKLIWDEIEDLPFDLPADEPLLLASYRAGDPSVGASVLANIEPLGVGALVPDMPAWIDWDLFVEVPLERAYSAAWDAGPADFRFLVEQGRLPDEGPPTN